MDLKRIEKLVWKETLKKIKDTDVKAAPHVSDDLISSAAACTKVARTEHFSAPAMKKGRHLPPLAFELFCVSETPRYGKVKCPRICRL